MLQQLSLDEFISLSKSAKRVAIYREVSADRLTPINIIDNLKEDILDGAILESAASHEDGGRYSFISFKSIAKFTVKNQQVSTDINGEISHHPGESPFTVLRELITALSVAAKQHSIDLIDGAVGFVTYDAVRLFETIPDRHQSNETTIPEMVFNFYQTTLAYDHLKQTLLVSVIVEVGENSHEIYQATQEKITQLIHKISVNTAANSTTPANNKQDTHIEPNDDDFIHLVNRAKEYILAGDAFQIVLSRTFTKTYTTTPFDIYRALRRLSPAPYMFYLPIQDTVIIGASPEKLISVRQRDVFINPIAGTRARLDKKEADIADELLQDKKELAEHIMLVDLARNDLGRVCTPGQIRIKEFLKVKHFSHVSHITSVIQGELSTEKDAFDALASAFPAGTLSGAPKIRAMEIIDELEQTKRGLYGGAICRFDYLGNLDSCIAIRMAILNNGTASIRTGAGIVYDSNPLLEANETRHKAQSVLAAIDFAEEGFL